MKGDSMAIKKLTITIVAMKDGKETTVHSCSWNGDLADWVDIGGEFAGAIKDYDKVVMTSIKPK